MNTETYKKYKWQSVAADFNSPFFRNYIWTTSAKVFKEKFDLPIPIIGISSIDGAINYIVDFVSWTETHEVLKKRALSDVNFVEKLIDQTNSFGEEFNAWSEKEIFNADLKSLNAEQMFALCQQFFNKQSMLYSYGITLPILDFLGFSFIEKNVEKFLKAKAPADKYQEYFDIFTFPISNSFAQDQEEDLLKLMDEFYTPNWISGVMAKTESEIKTTYPEFYSKLEAHSQKHAWVYYVYAGPAFTTKNFLGFIKDYLSKGVNPKSKLQELEIAKKNGSEQREKAILDLAPNQQEEVFLRLAGKLLWAKPRRKDYQSRSYYHFEKLQREIGRRAALSLSQVRSAPLEIIEQILKKGEVNTNLINSISKLHVCLPDGDTVRVLTGDEAKDFIDKYVVKEETQDYSKVKELKGNVASPGKKTGVVKIINRSEDMDKMNPGDILVSVATTPSIVPAMKRASAIITDEGGLTCHAAIVSRELGITCLIGTKIATKVLKDGDTVEVDTSKGIVRILN